MTKRILAVALAVLMLFLVAYPASAAIQATTVDVRGNVVSDPGTVYATWNAQSFAGFYYDLKNDRQTETLQITQTLKSVNDSGRSIDKENLWYNTTKVDVEFKMHEKENVQVLNSDVFQLVGWQAQKYVAVNGKANKLAKLALEMDKEDKKTLTTGETWSLGSGYEMTINAIDARTTPRQVWFTIKKDGAVIDEGIGQAPAGSLVADKQKAVYTKTMTILGQSDSLLFTVYVDTIFSGATSDMVQFKYAWLIDASTAKEIKSDDVFGVFKVRTTGDTNIKLSSDSAVSLSKNTDVTIMGNMKFKVADSDNLRFYPFVTYTDAGTYEVRGTVVSIVGATTIGNTDWNAQTFAGFYYDLKNNRQTETLKITQSLNSVNASGRSIDKENLWYNTTKVDVEFKMHEKENVQVLNSDVFQLVGWQAQKYIAVNGKANKLAKLALEMDKEDKKTLTTGETWSLGSGYELTINAIDARTTPRQVWFTIKKDGAVIDEGIGQAPAGSLIADKQKAVYTKTMTILGQSDSLLFTVYVDTIFSGATSDMVQFKYAWLIDASTANEIKSDDVYGVFKVRTTGDTDIKLSSDSAVSLSKNTEVTIMGEMKFKVADSDILRFYPKIDYVIGTSETPAGTTSGTAVVTAKGTTTGTATATATSTEGTSVATAEPTQATTAKTAAPAATTPTEPGFEAAFAIAGLLAVAFLVLRQRK